jgi:hypothetical protein
MFYGWFFEEWRKPCALQTAGQRRCRRFHCCLMAGFNTISSTVGPKDAHLPTMDIHHAALCQGEPVSSGTDSIFIYSVPKFNSPTAIFQIIPNAVDPTSYLDSKSQLPGKPKHRTAESLYQFAMQKKYLLFCEYPHLASSSYASLF